MARRVIKVLIKDRNTSCLVQASTLNSLSRLITPVHLMLSITTDVFSFAQ